MVEDVWVRVIGWQQGAFIAASGCLVELQQKRDTVAGTIIPSFTGHLYRYSNDLMTEREGYGGKLPGTVGSVLIPAGLTRPVA
jgi:hypothetical protein